MHYREELNFFVKLLRNLGLNVYEIKENEPVTYDIDLGVRKFLDAKEEYEKMYAKAIHTLRPNVIYTFSDNFHCNYILFQLPEIKEKTVIVIGPFAKEEFSKEKIFETVDKKEVSAQIKERLIRYYANVTYLSDQTFLYAALNTLGEAMWGSKANFSLQNVQDTFSEKYRGLLSEEDEEISEKKDVSFQMQLLEGRYEAENRFIQNVAKGYYHKAETSFTNSTLMDIEERVADPVRNHKNYCIIMNTLLRKAAELGAVHPIHIHRLSSEFAGEIELITSSESGKRLMQKMIHKYCLLVKNHSLKGYSLLVQKVITRIDTDLAADQTLNTHAKLLNVNPSYLSTLFKKETGSTLTDYVNSKRAQQGVYLLNTTNMQVQAIAQQCGISDVNYFSKIFKKYIGMTPSEYRNNVGN